MKLGRTLRQYHDGVLAAIRLRLSNGRMEGLNDKIGVIRHRAYGFHSDEAADVVSEALLRAEVIVAGLHLELRGSEALSARAFENLSSVLNEIPQIVATFESCSAGIRQGGGKPGVYEVPEYGAIHAIPGPAGGSVTPVVQPDLPATKRINKLVRLARDASRQFTQRRGVAVLGVRSSSSSRFGRTGSSSGRYRTPAGRSALPRRRRGSSASGST